MGRRKIEIEPITNERNRSVTFLKRKNGLFKKAYELGVLCSVDIAVIVFEERPGHPVKLHQYCSGNAQNLLQRHMRFDGPRELRTPHDFNDKLAEPDDDDDDLLDDDEPELPPPPPARSAKGGFAGSSSAPGAKPVHRAPGAREHPPAKRARLDALSLDAGLPGAPALGGLGGAAYRYTAGGPGGSAAGAYPPAGAGSLAALYPPPSSHAWSSAVGSALAASLPAYRDTHHAHRAPPASYNAGGSASSAFDFGAPPPPIRAAAAAAYAAGRADAYAAAAAAANVPPAPPAAPASTFGDVFDFEWPVHQQPPQASPPAPAAPVPSAPPRAPPSSSRSGKPPTSPDMSWLDFLSAPGGGAGGAGSAGVGADGAWPLRREDVWPADEGARHAGAGDRGRSESLASSTSFLPSPVESDGEEWDGRR